MNLKNKTEYIVYIDESNISASDGHSVYACIFIVYIKKELITNQLINIESDLKISYLHWVDMPWKLRIKFSEKIKNLNFICNFALYNNPIIQENTLENFLTKIVNTQNTKFKIIIDGKKGNRYKQRLKIKLKKIGIITSNLIFVNDKGEVFIRLADFMAGLIRSHTDDKNKHNKYMFDILKHKIKILN